MEPILLAIASAYRRKILQILRDRELSAGEVASHFPYVSRPNISLHLSVLKKARLLSERRAGTRRLYKTRPEAFVDLTAFIEYFTKERTRRAR
jgi:DNA-binding transcriptional ArsR family regulator